MQKNNVKNEHGEMFTVSPITPFWASNWHLTRKSVFFAKNLSTNLKPLKKYAEVVKPI
jgi:hypothetical protein